MPARVILVHDDSAFVSEAAAALHAAGIEVATFTDPMAALDAAEGARTVDLLITRIVFPPGKPNGVSLAQVTRNKRPDLKVLFVSLPEYVEHTKGLGPCLAMPLTVSDLMEAVHRLLPSDNRKEGPPPCAGCQ